MYKKKLQKKMMKNMNKYKEKQMNQQGWLELRKKK